MNSNRTGTLRAFIRRPTLGRTLIIVVVVKLAIMFLVLKLFFFPDLLQERFDTNKDRSDHVINEITNLK